MVVRPGGIEPPAYRFEACRSIQLSYGRVQSMYFNTSVLSLGDRGIGDFLNRKRPRAETPAAADRSIEYDRDKIHCSVGRIPADERPLFLMRAGSSIGRAADS